MGRGTRCRDGMSFGLESGIRAELVPIGVRVQWQRLQGAARCGAFLSSPTHIPMMLLPYGGTISRMNEPSAVENTCTVKSHQGQRRCG